MYAIIRAGGKQAKVREGDVLDVDRIKNSEGEVTFRPVLVVEEDGTVVSGRSALEKAKVVATILGENRGEKIEVFKYKNKSGYRRSAGHRQTYSRIQITKIEALGRTTKGATKKKAPRSKSEVPAVDEAPTETAAVGVAEED